MWPYVRSPQGLTTTVCVRWSSEIEGAEDDGRRAGGDGDGGEGDLHVASSPSQPQRGTARPGSITEPTGA